MNTNIQILNKRILELEAQNALLIQLLENKNIAGSHAAAPVTAAMATPETKKQTLANDLLQCIELLQLPSILKDQVINNIKLKYLAK